MIKKTIKILLIGLAATLIRIIGQLLIPAGEQMVLKPSVFAQNGTMPLAFTVYGIFAYSLIASLFLLIQNQLNGNRILQGLKYGLACSVIWIVYLWEPLPHVTAIDRITYPIADSLALIVIGLMLGVLFGNTQPSAEKSKNTLTIFPILTIIFCFLFVRIIQYLVFDIYSSFEDKPLETIFWCLITGIVLACVMTWLNHFITSKSQAKRAIILGCFLFGIDLFLFNFFMPLVFAADIPDLILRTCIDILAVTIGCLALTHRRKEGELNAEK